MSKDGDCGCTNGTHEPEAAPEFRVRGHEFTLPLLDTLYALRDLAGGLGEGATHRDYLLRVGVYLEEHHGASLTAGECDWLVDKLEELYAAAKKKRADAIAGRLTSPSSTASAPSG
jgi:hypothetical protein